VSDISNVNRKAWDEVWSGWIWVETDVRFRTAASEREQYHLCGSPAARYPYPLTATPAVDGARAGGTVWLATCSLHTPEDSPCPTC
jgi:hypothetical protein